jgi:radical SAM protein with 4Fe4S-binding SPASM domain
MLEDSDPFPDVVRIESVGLCNFRCAHCPTGVEPNGRRALSRDAFETILAQFISRASIPRVVVLYHGGEPLINQNLPLYIRRLKESGVEKTVITTNASLLTPERSRDLIEAGLDEMKVSFDGASPTENDTIRVRGSFARDAANLKAFCRVRRELGANNPRILVSNCRICDPETLLTLQRSKSQYLPEPASYLSDYFADQLGELEFQSVPAMVWPGSEDSSEFDVLELPGESPSYCDSLFETITIMSNGEVVPCCYDIRGELVLGNAFHRDVHEVWEDGRYVELRENFKQRKFHPVCSRCKVVRPRYLVRREEDTTQSTPKRGEPRGGKRPA